MFGWVKPEIRPGGGSSIHWRKDCCNGGDKSLQMRCGGGTEMEEVGLGLVRRSAATEALAVDSQLVALEDV